MKTIIERINNGTAERPLKGLCVESTLYIYNTKQEVLDEQAVSNGRVAGLTAWAKDISKFMSFSEDGATYEEKDLPSGDFNPDDFARLNEDARFQDIESNYGNNTTKHGLELKQDSNRWGQMNITNNLVLWQWDHPDDVTKTEKTRFLTIAQSGFDFQRSPKYLGVKLATVEELPMVSVDGVLKDVKSISAGAGVAISYDEPTGDLKLTGDGSNHEFKSKTLFDNASADTNTIGQGALYQFTGEGSAFATHRHEFNDDGVVWVLNLQSSLRSKFVNLSSSVGSVQATSCEVPANMVARFTYSKEANAINIEMSYFRGDLAKYVTEDQFNAKSGITGVHSGGGSTLQIEYWENGKIFSVSNSKIEVKLLQGMDVDHKHGYVKYINTRGSDVEFSWFDRFSNQINNSTVPAHCPANTVVEIFANYDTNDYFLSFSQSKVVASVNEETQLLAGIAGGQLYVTDMKVG
jgi:hypothetical protein